MVLRKIVTIPDSRLRRSCSVVERVDDRVRALMDDMLETMYEAEGIGLAAPQIGVMERIIVIHVAPADDEDSADDGMRMGDEDCAGRLCVHSDPLFIVNPEIIEHSDMLRVEEEGCLSIPDIREKVSRPDWIRVSFLDRTGALCEMECCGLLATCFQHEIDHLNGILFIDHLSRLKRARIMSRAEKEKRHMGHSKGGK